PPSVSVPSKGVLRSPNLLVASAGSAAAAKQRHNSGSALQRLLSAVDQLGQGGNIGIYHESRQLLKADFRPPAQLALRLGGPCKKHIDFRWSVKLGVDDHIAAPIEMHALESDLDELLNAVRLAGTDHIVVWLLLLEHEPHRPHIIAGKPPVALGLKVAQA